MGKVELRRGGNKTGFEKNVLEAWQSLEDIFFHILLILPSFGFLIALTWPLQPQEIASRGPDSGGLLQVGVMLPCKALWAAPCPRGGDGQAQRPPQPLSLLGLIPVRLYFPLCRWKQREAGR